MTNFSSAENGTFYANGGLVSGAFVGRVRFSIFDSTAATATLIATGGVRSGEGEGEGGGICLKIVLLAPRRGLSFLGMAFSTYADTIPLG